jgi:hypothetical protein
MGGQVFWEGSEEVMFASRFAAGFSILLVGQPSSLGDTDSPASRHEHACPQYQAGLE